MRWLDDWLERRDERRAARAYQERLDRGHAAWMASPKRAQIMACGHAHRTANPEATSATALGWNPETCDDCGIGISTIKRSSR